MSMRTLAPYQVQEITNRLPAQVIDYGIRLVNAPTAWSYSRGENIRVGIIDTGIDMYHPDLRDNYKGGYNFLDPSADPYDDHGHGTHVAGIIAGVDNGIGIVGVAPKAHLYALKAFNLRGRAKDADIIDAIQWAMDHKLHVINMSMGGPEDNPDLRKAIKKAYDQGITFVSAAGNRGGSGVDYPARWSDICISVGAVDRNRKKADFSTHGPGVDLLAPGVEIYSTYPRRRYVRLSGTSMATPHITGCVAILQGYRLKMKGDLLPPAKIQELLTSNCDHLGLPTGQCIFHF